MDSMHGQCPYFDDVPQFNLPYNGMRTTEPQASRTANGKKFCYQDYRIGMSPYFLQTFTDILPHEFIAYD
jgi:hypothetical protein